MTAKEELRKLEKTLYAYRYANAVIDYDNETVAPYDSSRGRAEAVEVLSRVEFDLLVNDRTADLLNRAEKEAKESGDEQLLAEVRELRIEYEETAKIPRDEYRAFSRLCQESMPAWVRAKQNNDFDSFAPYLEKIVESVKKQAEYIDDKKDPYEVLLNRFERGLTIEKCDEFFAELRETVVPLLAKIKEKGRVINAEWLDNDWPLDKQKELSSFIMKTWGLSPAHCAIGEAEHPFTINFNRNDVRITTHYKQRDMVSNLYSVAHEGGHALYELNIAPELDYTVLSGGSTMGIHECQSRTFENYVGRSRDFIHFLFPKLKELFPTQLESVTEDDFYKAVNKAEPGLIRTEADELTYPLHIMVRYEIEKDLIHGKLSVKDLPRAWNAKYKEYLGIEVPDDAHGVLQDIHWSQGSIGYFPSYALGSAYGAQAISDIQKTKDIYSDIRKGDLSSLSEELKNRVWKYGCLKEPHRLAESLCGGVFSPKYYTEYLKNKYSDIYF